MSRLILYQRDIAGQTLTGTPDAYIGDCTGTPAALVGDWTRATFFRCNFDGTDCSQADFHEVQSRFCSFRGYIMPPFIPPDDHHQIAEFIRQRLVELRIKLKAQLDLWNEIIEAADTSYISSYINFSPKAFQLLGEAKMRAFFSPHPELEAAALAFAQADPTTPLYGEKEPTDVYLVGERSLKFTFWGLAARNGDKRYKKHWMELPAPTRPHDRYEAARLIEQDVMDSIGLTIEVRVKSLLPFWATGRVRDA